MVNSKCCSIFNGVFETRISAQKREKFAQMRAIEPSRIGIYRVCIKHDCLVQKRNGLLTQGAEAGPARGIDHGSYEEEADGAGDDDFARALAPLLILGVGFGDQRLYPRPLTQARWHER